MNVKNTFTVSACGIMLALCLASSVALAKNISKEQNDAFQARQTYNENKAQLESLINSVAQQETRVKNEQARLNDLKSQEAAARSALSQSKADLDAKQKRLNEVWDSRDQ